MNDTPIQSEQNDQSDDSLTHEISRELGNPCDKLLHLILDAHAHKQSGMDLLLPNGRLVLTPEVMKVIDHLCELMGWEISDCEIEKFIRSTLIVT